MSAIGAAVQRAPVAHRFGGTGYDSDVFTTRKSLPSTVDSGVHRSKVHWSRVLESLQIGRTGIRSIGRLWC